MAGFWEGFKNFFVGSPAKYEQKSNLTPEQEALQNEYLRGVRGEDIGGAFGDILNYYRNLMSNNPADFAAFSAPALRQYNEQIVPGISEQFAGMGSGGLSSSGFRNAQTQGATDLAERLGALRAQLRQQGVQGLTGLAQGALQPYNQWIQTQQGSPGFLSEISPLAAAGLSAWGGGQIGNFGGAAGSKAGTTNPYGNPTPAVNPYNSYYGR